jgi:signal transduction histidine kinase/ligand-binding sensor domain-containing protein
MVVVTILLAYCAPSAALDPSLDISQFAHTSWKVRDGFAKGGIFALTQTPDGYMWLGTDYGLLRFDGVRAVPWQPPAGEQLPNTRILSLLSSRDGALWIGTSKGLARWKDGKLTTFPELRGLQVLQVIEDREGVIWAGGLAVLNQGKLCAIRASGMTCYGEDGSLGGGPSGLYEDSKGNLWVAAGANIWRWKPGAPESFAIPGEKYGARGLVEDRDGALLIASHSGVQRLAAGRIEPYPASGLAQQGLVYRMFRDRDSAIWIGTSSHGLMRIHQGRADSLTEPEGLTSDSVLDIFEDREGDVWVATFDGLDRFRPYSVQTLSEKQGLPGGQTWSVLAARDSSVLIASTVGLSRWDRGTVSPVGKEQFTRTPPDSLFQDSRGKIWVSTLTQFGSLDDGRFHPVSGYGQGSVNGLVEDTAGDLWIVNQQSGLYRLSGGVLQNFPWAALGRKDFGASLAADRARKGIWIGFYQTGIAYFEDGKIRASYSAADGLGEGKVNDLRFGSRGTLWAATDGGLSRIRDGHISTLTTKNGLPCDTVHWSMEDNDHAVWIYAPCGLSRVTRSDMDAWAADPRKVVEATIFDQRDGVRTRSLGGGFRPLVTKAPDGKMWFAAFDGVSVIDPHNLEFNHLPPSVHIEQIVADGKTYWQNLWDEATSRLPLPALSRNLEIDYTALSFVVPEKIRFRYKLEGWDRDWQDAGNRRQAFYTNLSPRNYRFRVIACNNSGVWNEAGAALEFSVAPAWYQATWFRVSCVAAFLALLWVLYQLRVRQLAWQFNMRLEERVGERTRIARDLHDTLLQSFHGTLLRFQVAYDLLPTRPAEAKQSLGNAIDQAAEAITEGRDAIQDLRSSTVETNDLARAINALAEELAADTSNPAVCHISVEGTSRNLHPILRDEVYRIAGEALRNAFRHAQARQIEVEIHYDERRLRLRMRDDGVGIDRKFLSEEGRPGHFGLHGMRERAQLVAGKLTVWSELNSGTEVELTVPASIAYAVSPMRRRFWRSDKGLPETKSEKETDVKS